MPITVYRSSDDGAPRLSATLAENTDVAAILEACLVTGYGAKGGQGWTKPYTSGTTTVFRQPTLSTNGFYLRLDASYSYATSGNVGYDVAFRGYESMADANTGTGPFPTTAQAANGVFQMRMYTNGTACEWVLFTNGKIFYFIVYSPGDTAGTVFAFGDITPVKSGDAYATVIIGNDNVRNGSNHGRTYARFPLTTTLAASTTANYAARSHTQLGGSVAIGKHADATKTVAATWGADGLVYPNPADNKLWFVPAWVHESTKALRGILPGIWVPCHALPLVHGSRFYGTGDYLDRQFEVVGVAAGVGTTTVSGQVFIEVTGDWG